MQKANCQHVDPMLLVRLLRLKPRSRAPPRVMVSSKIKSVQFFLQAGPLASVTEKVTSTASSSVQPKPASRVFSRRNRTASSQASSLNQRLAIPSLMSSSTSNTNRQLDVSSPSTKTPSYTFIDRVESFLAMKNFALLEKSKGQNTGNFYRWTLTLAEVDGRYTL